MNTIIYSIIVPVYNESKVVNTFYERTVKVMDSLSQPYEMVFVNDGSTDNTKEIILQLRLDNPCVKLIDLSRNFGHQSAITAGMDYVRGKAVIIIDVDLQDPPEVIPELIHRWQEGYEVVYAVREQRKGETIFKKLTAKLFYRLVQKISNINIPLDTGDFRLVDRKVLTVLKSIRERHRFVRGLVSWVGFKQTGVPYIRAERYSGETKYPLRKMLRFAFDGVTSFSQVPLQLASFMGMIVSLIGAMGIIVIIVLKLMFAQFVAGMATIMILILFMGGVQLISLGIIGEYLGRIYDEVKQRPLYVINETVGCENNGK